MLVGFFGIATNATIAPPSGTTERGEIVGSGANKIASEGADERSPAGPSGAHVAKASKAAVSIGHVVVLKPAP